MWSVMPSTSASADGDLEDLAVRDGAVGLEDDLAAAFADPVANELPRLFDRRGGTFAVAQQEPRLGASGGGLEQGQERRGRLLDARRRAARGGCPPSRRRSNASRRA